MKLELKLHKEGLQFPWTRIKLLLIDEKNKVRGVNIIYSRNKNILAKRCYQRAFICVATELTFTGEATKLSGLTTGEKNIITLTVAESLLFDLNKKISSICTKNL